MFSKTKVRETRAGRELGLPFHLMIELWIFRVVWLSLPFTAGPVFSAALEDTSDSFRVGVTIGLWVLWAAMLIASMVPRTQTFTALRVIAPAAFVVTLWAAFDATSNAETWQLVLALVAAGIAAAMALRSVVGDEFVDGSSYGDESRFLLSAPGALVLGPIQLVWAAIVGGALAGPLLLLAHRWILGGILLVIGWAIAYFAVPILDRLSHRWLVFVPAGVVVHDKTALREPQLFRKETVAVFGPAPADTTLEDLSLSSSGLALRAKLTEPSKIIPNSRDATVETADIDGWIVSPNRPGAVVAEAKERGFTIG